MLLPTPCKQKNTEAKFLATTPTPAIKSTKHFSKLPAPDLYFLQLPLPKNHTRNKSPNPSVGYSKINPTPHDKHANPKMSKQMLGGSSNDRNITSNYQLDISA
jgi:hypothetical protein